MLTDRQIAYAALKGAAAEESDSAGHLSDHAFNRCMIVIILKMMECYRIYMCEWISIFQYDESVFIPIFIFILIFFREKSR